VVFQTLCANLALNSVVNVHCRQAALGEQPGTATIPPLNYAQENNFGGVALGGAGAYKGEEVPVVTLDSLNLPRCEFLKIDVEGMELNVLRGAEQTIRRLRPILYVENDRDENSPQLIEYLQSLGYVLYWHLPPLFRPNNFYRNPSNEFGRVVSANMLGIHASVPTNIAGLRKIDTPQSSWRQRPADSNSARRQR
jgi:FkbM family methyltransferase